MIQEKSSPDQQPGLDLLTVVGAAARRLAAAGVVCGHGTAEPYSEACWLAAHALGLDPTSPLPRRILAPGERAAIERWIERRIFSRKPAAYLTGEAWFAGLKFKVNDAVLVPRSPLAEVILDRFAPWRGERPVHRILDLCCGSGCIGIAAALAFPEAGVDLADLDPAALAVARDNGARYDLGRRAELHCGDLFTALPDERRGGYDVILANPPYVPDSEMADLAPEYRAEPAAALAGGADGLDFAARILGSAADWLAPAGLLFLEVGGSWPTLAAALPDIGCTWLEFSAGGDGVMLIAREELDRAAPAIAAWRARRRLALNAKLRSALS